MAVSESYRVFILEQLGRVMPVTARAMFGGVGIYAQGLFFALIAEDRLYFKVDETSRPGFEGLGMEPFRPFGEEKAMGYYEVPADVMEGAARLAVWMNRALEVAAKAKSGKSQYGVTDTKPRNKRNTRKGNGLLTARNDAGHARGFRPGGRWGARPG